MAAKKKKTKKTVSKHTTRTDDVAIYAEFIADMLAGLFGTAVQLYESRDSNGMLVLEFDQEEDA